MRLAFWILLLANLSVFVWVQGYVGLPREGREPERLQREIQPEKLRIITQSAEQPVPTPLAAPLLTCKRIAWLTAAQSGTIRDALSVLPDFAVTQTAVKDDPMHWVAIPSLANRDLAQKKKAELARLGIKEAEIIEVPGETSPGPFAVSLGLFNDAGLAEEFLKSLNSRGVRSAQLLKREATTDKFALDIKAPVGITDTKLQDLMTVLPQATLTDCPAS